MDSSFVWLDSATVNYILLIRSMCEEVKYCICMHKFYYRYSIGQNVAIHRFIAVDGVLASGHVVRARLFPGSNW